MQEQKNSGSDPFCVWKRSGLMVVWKCSGLMVVGAALLEKREGETYTIRAGLSEKILKVP